MRLVDPTEFMPFYKGAANSDLGVVPDLRWIEIVDLRIDPAYQREVLRNGASNVVRIAREFDWSLFGIVVVAALEDGLYAIVDGQHRTLAAAIRQIAKVPCIIIKADARQQAKAFAAINGAVTKISPLQIFNAEIAAGQPDAIVLRDALAAADISICKYPVPSNKMKPGDTLAVNTMKRMLRMYSAAHLTTCMRCITKTGLNVGVITEPVVKALCQVLDAEPSWKQSEAALHAAFREFKFAQEVHAAEVLAKQKHMQVATVLAMRLFEYLDAELGA